MDADGVTPSLSRYAADSARRVGVRGAFRREATALDFAAGVAALAGRAKIMPIRISDPYGYAAASTVASSSSCSALMP